MAKKNKKEKIKGFSMVELVITISLTGFLFVMVALFMTYPIQAYSDVRQRADLLDASEAAFQRIRADLQEALPNSIRVKQDPNNPDRVALEFIHVVDSIRYRAQDPNPYLDFTGSGVTVFDTLGILSTAPTHPSCVANNCRLVVYNTGAYDSDSDHPSAGLNAYSTEVVSSCPTCSPLPGSVTISPSSTTVSFATNGNESQLSFNNPVLFANPSPQQLLYIVDTPVSYVCDSTADQQRLSRYWGYAIAPVQATDPSQEPFVSASTAPLAKYLSSCSFSYTPGTASTYGTVNLSLGFTRGNESITLMQQITVENAL